MASPRALALCLLGVLAAPAAAQEPPPDADWRTFGTEHFRVTYQPELEGLARWAASVAERTHDVLSRELTDPPDGIIDLVIADHVDYSNGFSRPFPSNRITLFARPAATGEFFARDWIELVTVHEVVHAFHLDQTAWVGGAVRAVLGRVPTFWPVFPVIATPSWSTEGLATHYETRLTGAGRVQAALHDMIIRTAALADAFPTLDGLAAPNPVWPAGNRSYIYGARFMRYVADRYGPGAHRALIEATRGSIWPTFLRFDHVAEGAVGVPFDALYAGWTSAATDSARAVENRVRAAGVTATRPVAGSGPYAVAPRVSPDGGRLTFAASDWRSDPATRVVDLETGAVRQLARRNQFGALLDPAGWLPDGSAVIVAQLEYQGPYQLFSDLWRVDVDGGETRLTEGRRLAQPDVAPDGRRVAAVQNHRAGLRLAVQDLDTGETRVVADASPGQSYDGPRWSPDGRTIAAARHVDGRTDLVVVEASTGAVTRITDDTALDMAPAWSPDGRWLLWWSDRTGIPNILAVAMERGRPTGPVRQVTNVVTGVIDPEVSPDGGTLYLSAYHADGWRIEAMPFDPGTWRMAPAPSDRYADAVLASPAGLGGGRDGAGGGGAPDAGERVGEPAARPYSPLPTLRPYYWIPTWDFIGSSDDGSRLRFIGGTVGGTDVIRRHSWLLELMGDIDTGRFQGRAFWLYRGLGTPELFAIADRDWAVAGSVATSAGVVEPILLRDDQITVGARFRHRRFRQSAVVEIAAELERQQLEGRTLTDTELAAGGIRLVEPLTLVGLSVAPALGNARRHRLSISPEDGIGIGVGVGRWWSTGDGARAYDEGSARLSGYLGVPVWGFANHVLAARGAAFVREGDLAPVRSIGGPGVSGLLIGGDGSSYPVRGFDSGDRLGTRGWTVNAEWRFPLHLRGDSGGIFGFSLISIAGAVFLDAGNAWCTSADREVFSSCAPASTPPLVSAGAELKIDVGLFHNAPGRLSLGIAQPIQGPGEKPVLYLGTAF